MEQSGERAPGKVERQSHGGGGMQTTKPSTGDPRREAAMWGVEFNSDPHRSVVTHVLTLAISANAAGVASSTVTVQVVPPPGPDGLLPARDGRRQRVPDVRALAAKLNRQDPKARVDTDHRSEPASPTFVGETAAGGWLSHYRPNSDGGIDADMELGEGLRGRLRRKEYAYISPAYLLGRDGVVRGLSSIALVNNPNLPLDAPTLHSMQQDAVDAVDAAVLNGRVAPATRDYFLSIITRNRDGIAAGLRLFEGYLNTQFEAEIDANAAGLRVPHGYCVRSGERLALHAKIEQISRSERIPYREALRRCPTGAASTVPTPDLHAMQAYEQMKPQIDAALTRISAIPANGLLAAAKKCLEIAEMFAEAGRWGPAVRAVEFAKTRLKASDDLVFRGSLRAAKRLLDEPEPTPDQFLIGVERMG